MSSTSSHSRCSQSARLWIGSDLAVAPRPGCGTAPRSGSPVSLSEEAVGMIAMPAAGAAAERGEAPQDGDVADLLFGAAHRNDVAPSLRLHPVLSCLAARLRSLPLSNVPWISGRPPSHMPPAPGHHVLHSALAIEHHQVGVRARPPAGLCAAASAARAGLRGERRQHPLQRLTAGQQLLERVSPATRAPTSMRHHPSVAHRTTASIRHHRSSPSPARAAARRPR